jgi:phage regulator Rha-like protein
VHFCGTNLAPQVLFAWYNMQMKEETSLVKIEIPAERIAQLIFIIRGKKVMIDKDLADLYKVETRNLNKAVQRNIGRFPIDFMFQLTKQEFENLMFQFGTSRWGGTRKFPYVFTEHGVVMLSSVLKSEKAIEMNISIVRAFTKLRELLATNKDLAVRMDELERHQKSHSQHLVNIYSTLKKLTAEPLKEEGTMGFNVGAK